MMYLSLSVSPENDEEAAMVLSMLTASLQSLAFKGVSASLTINPFPEDEDEEIEERNEG